MYKKNLEAKGVGYKERKEEGAAARMKILIKVPMISKKSRLKAMKLIAAQGGVYSVAIEGEDRDHFFFRVTGDNIDCVKLTRTLKKVACVEIVSITPDETLRKKVGERSERSAILVEESRDDVHFSSPPKELDKVSTSEGKGSEPGSGRQGSSGTLRPVIFFDYEIHEATNNLNDSSKIGEGGHGSVYKGEIDRTEVAIKILSNTGYQGIKEFHREIGALGLVRHANLVNLIGTCFQLRALVYEYLPNGSLEDCLMKRSAELTWEIRTRIVYEICTTLRFLHANRPDPLVHGNLNPHNVLFDANFKTKLADFGLYRFLTQGEKSHMMKTFDGSTDYIDPDFMESGIVRPAMDVYSFGKTIIRILTGKRPAEISREVHEARKRKTLMTIVDPAATDWPEEIVEVLARFALRCCKYRRYDVEFMWNFYTELGMILHDINVDADMDILDPK